MSNGPYVSRKDVTPSNTTSLTVSLSLSPVCSSCREGCAVPSAYLLGDERVTSSVTISTVLSHAVTRSEISPVPLLYPMSDALRLSGWERRTLCNSRNTPNAQNSLRMLTECITSNVDCTPELNTPCRISNTPDKAHDSDAVDVTLSPWGSGAISDPLGPHIVHVPQRE